MTAFFSVLLSVYYKENSLYLRKALDSIWNQTLKPSEIIIVKDGPLTEELDLVLSDFASHTPVKFIVNEHNMGLAFSLNRGILYSKYEFIARMDSDDIALSERFEKQIKYLTEHKEIDCVGTWAIEVDSKEKEYYKKKMPVNHQTCFAFFKKRDCLIHPTVMFRRTFFEKAGLYPEDTYFGEDTMMWANGFKNGCKFSNIPEYLLKFRVSNDFFKRRRGWKHAVSIYKLRKKVNQNLNYGLIADVYAVFYACIKMMPKSILNFLYKTIR